MALIGEHTLCADTFISVIGQYRPIMIFTPHWHVNNVLQCLLLPLSLSGLRVCVSGIWWGQSQPGAEEDGWHPGEHWKHRSQHLKLFTSKKLRNNEVLFSQTTDQLAPLISSCVCCCVCWISFDSVMEMRGWPDLPLPGFCTCLQTHWKYCVKHMIPLCVNV